MRLSSSLLVILAALTMANAGVVDTVTQPKHKMVRVKNGAAHVNALDAAKVKVDKLGVAKLDHLVSASALRRGVDVSALGAAHAGVKTVNLKHVAGIVHTLSASLDSHNAEADKILKLKDRKLAAVKTEKLLHSVKHELAHAVVDLAKAKSAAKSTATVSAKVARRTVADLKAVAGIVKSANIAGATGLVSLLSGLKVDTVLESDVVSVLADADVLKAIHDVANVDTVLSAVLAVPDSVKLLENIKQLDDPVAFVGALADVHSLTALVAAVPTGANEMVKVQGAAKLVDYVGKYGFNTVARVFSVAGVESVLGAVVALPSSVQLLSAVKSVVDVPALVSGLHVLNAVGFVESIKAVSDVAAVSNVALSLVDTVLGKRELLQGVEGTVAGATSAVDLDQVLGLVKRADLLSNVGGTVGGTVSGVESAVDLNQVLDLVKRADLLSNVEGTVGGTLSGATSAVDLNQVLDLVKRADLLSNVGGTVSSVTSGVASAVDLNQVLSLVKRADLLDNVTGTVSGLTSAVDLQKVLKLKRAIAHIDALPDSDLATIDAAVRRSLVDNVDVSKVLDKINVAKLGLLRRSVLDVASVVNADGVDKLVDEVVERDVVKSDNELVDLDSILGLVKREVVESDNELVDLDSVLGLLKREVVESTNELVDLDSLLGVLKRAIPVSVSDDITTLDLLHVVPAVKRAIARTTPHAVDYTTIHPLHTRHNTAGAILTDAVDTLVPSVSTLLTKVVHITDAVHEQKVTLDVKHKVVPLVAAVGSALDSVVSVQAPDVASKVQSINKLAAKTVKSLP